MIVPPLPRRAVSSLINLLATTTSAASYSSPFHEAEELGGAREAALSGPGSLPRPDLTQNLSKYGPNTDSLGSGSPELKFISLMDDFIAQWSLDCPILSNSSLATVPSLLARSL